MKAFITILELPSGVWSVVVNIPRKFLSRPVDFEDRHGARERAGLLEDILLRHGYDPVIRYRDAA